MDTSAVRCPTLSTDRLVLRPFEESDLDAYVAVLQTPEVRSSLHLPEDVGRDEAWAQMAMWSGQWALRGTGQWAVEERATGQLVGRAGPHRPERHDWPGIEIGWTFHPLVWGRGYATEAGQAAIDWVFSDDGPIVDGAPVDEVFSLILGPNDRSAAVARRLGFSLVEARVFDFFPAQAHGVWRLGRDQWASGR